MAVWSRFASTNLQKLEFARRLIASLKNGAQGKASIEVCRSRGTLLSFISGVNYVPVRNSHDRTLPIRTSTYMIFKVKDLLYFYLGIGMIGFGSIILYSNIFIGPAKLALIPEGYNPKPWEYHQHPITRFFARYLPSKQEHYERSCHSLFVKKEKSDIRKLENKIHDLMKKREDYQAWYFNKPQAKYIRELNRSIKKGQLEPAEGPGWIK